jgi:Skp family chaperone for outer membrane proteins
MKPRTRPALRLFAALLLLPLAFTFTACSTNGLYYRAAEKVGYHKRDILVSRVEDAREAQTEAKEQFQDALTQFLALTQADPGEIKNVYDKLNGELRDCQNRAAEVRKRIASVEDVGAALFREWEAEAQSISDRDDRRESERLLRETRDRADGLIRTMNTAAERMDPVLQKFRDKVLVLKANLNAQAVAGLSGTARGLEADVGRLVADMEKSIREAEAFLGAMRPAPSI